MTRVKAVVLLDGVTGSSHYRQQDGKWLFKVSYWDTRAGWRISCWTSHICLAYLPFPPFFFLLLLDYFGYRTPRRSRRWAVLDHSGMQKKSTVSPFRNTHAPLLLNMNTLTPFSEYIEHMSNIPTCYVCIFSWHLANDHDSVPGVAVARVFEFLEGQHNRFIAQLPPNKYNQIRSLYHRQAYALGRGVTKLFSSSSTSSSSRRIMQPVDAKWVDFGGAQGRYPTKQNNHRIEQFTLMIFSSMQPK